MYIKCLREYLSYPRPIYPMMIDMMHKNCLPSRSTSRLLGRQNGGSTHQSITRTFASGCKKTRQTSSTGCRWPNSTIAQGQQRALWQHLWRAHSQGSSTGGKRASLKLHITGSNPLSPCSYMKRQSVRLFSYVKRVCGMLQECLPFQHLSKEA